MDIEQLQQGELIRGERVDASEQRERVRQRRLRRLLIVLGVPLAWIWIRELQGNPVGFGLPNLIGDDPTMAISIGLLLALMCLILIPFLGAGHSPHVLLRPSDSNVRLNDVVVSTSPWVGRRGPTTVRHSHLAWQPHWRRPTRWRTPRHGALTIDAARGVQRRRDGRTKNATNGRARADPTPRTYVRDARSSSSSGT